MVISLILYQVSLKNKILTGFYKCLEHLSGLSLLTKEPL